MICLEMQHDTFSCRKIKKLTGRLINNKMLVKRIMSVHSLVNNHPSINYTSECFQIKLYVMNGLKEVQYLKDFSHMFFPRNLIN